MVESLWKKAFFAGVGFLFFLPGMAGAQSLQEAMGKTFANHPKLGAAAEEVKIIREEIKMARSRFMPKVTARGEGGFEWNYEQGQEDFAYRGVLALTQNIFDGGENFAKLREARARVEQAELTDEEAKEEIAQALAETYLDLIRFRRLLELAQRNAATHKEVLGQIRSKYTSGASSQADVTLAEARYALAESTVESRRRELEMAGVMFQYLVGKEPGKLVMPVLPQGILPGSVEKISVAKNPTLLAAEASVKAAAQAAKAARGVLYPRVDLQGTADAKKNFYDYDNDNSNLSVMAVVSYDVFDGGMNQAVIRQKADAHRKAIKVMETTKLTLEKNMRNAWYEADAADRRQVLLLDYVKALAQTVAIYTKQFRIGQRLLLNVLDEKNELFNAQSAAENEYYNGVQAKWRLVHSMGSCAKTIKMAKGEEKGLPWDELLPPLTEKTEEALQDLKKDAAQKVVVPAGLDALPEPDVVPSMPVLPDGSLAPQPVVPVPVPAASPTPIATPKPTPGSTPVPAGGAGGVLPPPVSGNDPQYAAPKK